MLFSLGDRLVEVQSDSTEREPSPPQPKGKQQQAEKDTCAVQCRPDGNKLLPGLRVPSSFSQDRKEVVRDATELDGSVACLSTGTEGQEGRYDDFFGRQLVEGEALEVEDENAAGGKEADAEVDVRRNEDVERVGRMAVEQQVRDVGSAGCDGERRHVRQEPGRSEAFDAVLVLGDHHPGHNEDREETDDNRGPEEHAGGHDAAGETKGVAVAGNGSDDGDVPHRQSAEEQRVHFMSQCGREDLWIENVSDDEDGGEQPGMSQQQSISQPSQPWIRMRRRK